MTTDHSVAIQCLRNAALKELSYGRDEKSCKLYDAAIALNRLEAQGAARTITAEAADRVILAYANAVRADVGLRALTTLDPDDDWVRKNRPRFAAALEAAGGHN